MVMLLEVVAAALLLTGVEPLLSHDFYTVRLPPRIVESADADMDGKASTAEMFHLFTVLFYKTSLEEVTLLDADSDGFLSVDELKIELSNTEWLRRYIKRDSADPLTIDEVYKFLTDRGMEISPEMEDVLHDVPEGEANVRQMIMQLLFAAIFSLYEDFSMIRSQLRFANVDRMFMSNSMFEELLKEHGSVEDGSCSTEWLAGYLKEESAIVLDLADFGERVTPAEIRNMNVTRATLGWPSANADGKFSVDELIEFGKLYQLSYGEHPFIRMMKFCFLVEEADNDNDGYMSEEELREWLKESADALLDENFYSKMVPGVDLHLTRVANILERYSSIRMRSRKKMQLGNGKSLLTAAAADLSMILGYKRRTTLNRSDKWKDQCIES